MLTVVAYGHRCPNGANTIAGVRVRCSCGNETVIPVRKLEPTKSCGCARGGNRRGATTGTYEKHGMIDTPEYRSWQGMMQRCNDPNSTSYANYGGRGISVCARWHDFRNFYADMGARPEGMTLDRFPDNDGNYELGNCRWATGSEQRSNQRPRQP